MTKLQKVFYYFAWVALAISGTLLLIAIYWIVYPYDNLTFQEGNGAILTKEVKQGEYISLQQNYCKKGDFTTEIDRQFIDGFIYTAPPVLGRRPEGCREVVELVYIPKNLPVGKYFISTNVSYQPNPIREVKLNVTTEKFMVVK